MRDKKAIIVLVLFSITTGLYSAQHRYINAGSKIYYQNKSVDFYPYIDFYSVDDRETGILTRSRLNYRYTDEDKDINEVFDGVSAPEKMFFYIDKRNYYESKEWFLHIGDEISSFSPTVMWANKLRGVIGGVTIGAGDRKSLFHDITFSGFWGITKARVKGYEGATTESNENGQFRQYNYGGGIGFSISKDFRVEGLYTIYKDDKNSLKTNEDYLSTPVENHLAGLKIGYYTGTHRAYISFSYSTYDQDIRSESDKKLSDFAVYGEYNGYINFLHLIGKLYYIGEEYFTEGKSGFENDIMKAEVIYNWRILKDMTVSGNIYYLRNNTGFKPVEEYLTYNTVKGSLNFIYEFTSYLIGGLRTGYGFSKNVAGYIGTDKVDWKYYEGGVDITARFILDEYSFKTVRFTLTGTYSKKDDKSITSGTPATSQELFNIGLINGTDLERVENRLTGFFYNIKNGDTKEQLLTLTEKFLYRVKWNVWHPYISLNYKYDTINNEKNYQEMKGSLGHEIYLTYSDILKIETGYGEKKVYTETAGEGYVRGEFKVEYRKYF